VHAAAGTGGGILPAGLDVHLSLEGLAFEVRRPDEVALSTLARKVLKAAGVVVAALAGLSVSRLAHAEEAVAPSPRLAREETATGEDDATLSPSELERYRALSSAPGPYARVFTTLAAGRGARFNNPFRLPTQLGARPESLSLTAPYVDVGLGLGFGDPFGWQHGPNVHAAFATSGVPQGSLAASYMVLHRGSSPLLSYGRAGVVLLTAPDVNMGGEIAAGLSAFFTGALGATAEVVGDLFYGAGTYETRYTVVPVVSLQLGLMVDLEVLP
jgi:hypothetical protein